MMTDESGNKLGKYESTEYVNRRYIKPFKNTFELCINNLLMNYLQIVVT